MAVPLLLAGLRCLAQDLGLPSERYPLESAPGAQLETGNEERSDSAGWRFSRAHVALGDSITACVGAGSRSSCYPVLLSDAERASLESYAVSGALACDTSDQAFVPEATASSNAIYTLMIGTNDADTKGRGAYESVYRLCHQAVMAWLALPKSAKVPASHCQAHGPWAADSAYRSNFGMVSSSSGATLTCSITTVGAPVYAWYRMIDGNSGQFSYSVDGGSAIAVTASTSPAIATQNGGRQGMGLIRIAGIAAGPHTVTFAIESATAKDSLVSIFAIGSPNGRPLAGHLYAAGVPRFARDERAADTAAYDQDALEDVNLLAADGLPITFVDVRKYIDLSTDMNDGLHPNTAGHAHIRDAFLRAEQDHAN